MSTAGYPTPISCIRKIDTLGSEHHFSSGTPSNQTNIQDAGIDAHMDSPCDHFMEAMSGVLLKAVDIPTEDVNTGDLESRSGSLVPLNDLQNNHSERNNDESDLEAPNDLYTSAEMDTGYVESSINPTMLTVDPSQTSHDDNSQVNVDLEDAELYHLQPDHENFLSGEPPLNWFEAARLSEFSQLKRKTSPLTKTWNRMSNDIIATYEIKHYSTQKDIHAHPGIAPQKKTIQAHLLDPILKSNQYPTFDPAITNVQYSTMLASHQYQLLQATVRNIGPCTLDNALFVVEAIHNNRRLGKHLPITAAEMNMFAHSHSNVDKFGTVKKWTAGWQNRSMEEMADGADTEEDIDLTDAFGAGGGRARVSKHAYWGGKGFFESGDDLYDSPYVTIACIKKAKTVCFVNSFFLYHIHAGP